MDMQKLPGSRSEVDFGTDIHTTGGTFFFKDQRARAQCVSIRLPDSEASWWFLVIEWKDALELVDEMRNEVDEADEAEVGEMSVKS